MLYEMKTYQDNEQFNADAKLRYDQVMRERTATSYDAFWRMGQVVRFPSGVFHVIWSKPAPLRKH